MCQSLSYVLPILLWLAQIKSSEGTVSTLCASPETLLLFFFFFHDKEQGEDIPESNTSMF